MYDDAIASSGNGGRIRLAEITGLVHEAVLPVSSAALQSERGSPEPDSA